MSEQPKRVMLSLIGEQPMPNIIAALQEWGGWRVDEVVLIYSSTKFRGIGVNIEQVLEKDKFGVPCRLQQLPKRIRDVSGAYDIDAVKDVCAAEIAKALSDGGDPDNVLVNITGGTKPMAVGAYLAAQAHRCPVVYVDTDQNRILRWTAHTGYRTPESLNFSASDLKVEDYLEAHRVNLQANRPEKTETAKQALLKWRDGIYYLAQVCSKRDHELRAIRAVAQKDYAESLENRSDEMKTLLDYLKGFGLIEDWSEVDWRIRGTKEQAALLNGDWLEYYVFDQTRRQNPSPSDCRVGMSLERKLEGMLGGKVADEFDVLALWGPRLVVAECKSGPMNLRDRDNTLLSRSGEQNEPILDLAANTDQMGLFCGRVIVLSRDIAADGEKDEGGLKVDFVRRAVTLNVAPVFGKYLKEVGAIMRNPDDFIRDLSRQYRVA